MDKYRSYVGMDVHARSITLASLDTETGEVSRGRLTGSPGAAEVSAWARERCGGEILLAYESGPTGFGLARELSASDGMECVVVAVSTMARSQRERRMKCDPLDAAAVLREISCPRAPPAPSPGSRASRRSAPATWCARRWPPRATSGRPGRGCPRCC